MKILCVFGEHNYGDPSRGQGYEYANFIPALQQIEHEVVFFESLNKSRYSGFIDLNRAFLSVVERERPDIIFCVLMHYELWIETFEIAKRMCNATLINWSTDDSWKYHQFSRLIAPSFDLYATTSHVAFAKAKRDGLKNFYMTQWAAAGVKLQEPMEAGQCRYPVSFIGSRYGNRSEWVKKLRDNGINVACFGHGWENGVVASEEIPRIMRESVISLNFGDSDVVMEGFLPSRSRQIKARVFEVPGCGGFLLSQAADDLGRCYELGAEVTTFDNIEDLVRKINHYLTHPVERDRIARAGYARTRADHTYESRFSQLLQEAMTLSSAGHAAVASKSKGRLPKSLDDFHTVVSRHRQTIGLRLLRSALMKPCVLIWGKKRGPRAARRILFELSWRLFGRFTYTAAGWPGRIFYRES